MFVGFLDRKELETAIRLQYPDLTKSQLGFICRDLNEMDELMTQSSCDIAAGMVTLSYEQQNDLAFTDWMQIRMRRAQEWETEQSSTDSSSFQSEPGMVIDSIAVDPELLVHRDSEPPEEMT